MTQKTNAEKLGQGVSFQRIRRITGYLVGTMEQWNNAKRAEERDRVKHSMTKESPSAPRLDYWTYEKRSQVETCERFPYLLCQNSK